MTMPETDRTPTEPTPDPDAAVMARIAAGEAGAFEELIRRHQRRVYTLVYRSVGSAADAEDLVQEVFLRVYRAADRYRPTARFTTWLYRVTTNVVINWLRRHRRKPVELERVAGTEDGEGAAASFADPAGVTGLDVLAREELRAQVRRAIDALPPKQRLTVILFRFEGRSYQEVAAALSCSVMAVKSLLSRARENLRRELGPYVAADGGFSAKQPVDDDGSNT